MEVDTETQSQTLSVAQGYPVEEREEGLQEQEGSRSPQEHVPQTN